MAKTTPNERLKKLGFKSSHERTVHLREVAFELLVFLLEGGSARKLKNKFRVDSRAAYSAIETKGFNWPDLRKALAPEQRLMLADALAKILSRNYIVAGPFDEPDLAAINKRLESQLTLKEKEITDLNQQVFDLQKRLAGYARDLEGVTAALKRANENQENLGSKLRLELEKVDGLITLIKRLSPN